MSDSVVNEQAVYLLLKGRSNTPDDEGDKEGSDDWKAYVSLVEKDFLARCVINSTDVKLT